jgi:hypothetical protein
VFGTLKNTLAWVKWDCLGDGGSMKYWRDFRDFLVFCLGEFEKGLDGDFGGCYECSHRNVAFMSLLSTT